jgi:tetratricopeptide (TPR) repeat protein
MSEPTDLEALRVAWVLNQDGETGCEYGEALAETGDVESGAVVLARVAELGYPYGYYCLAWLERHRDNIDLACDLMQQALEIYDGLEDEWGDAAAGVLGMWQWDFFARIDSEELLRRGAEVFQDSRADLAHVLLVTNRAHEAEAILRRGVSLREVSSCIVLGNILRDSGRTDEAESTYELGYELGDAFCAYNLALMLDDQGRDDAVSHWMWLAAEGGDEMAITYLASAEPDVNDSAG